MKHINVYVVLLQRTLLLDAAGPLEVLRVANREQQDIRFEVHYIGPETPIVSSIGITLAKIEPLPKTLPNDAMVVLSGDVDYIMMPGMQVAPRQVGDRDAVVGKWLRAVVRPAHKVVSICSGALLRARQGSWTGIPARRITVAGAELAAIAPKAKVLENRLFVEDRERYSSAGGTAGVDLMLHIVSQLTNLALAVSIARYMVVYLRRSGSDPQLSPWLEARNHIHPAVHQVQDAITADPTKAWTLRVLAMIGGASSRHLSVAVRSG